MDVAGHGTHFTTSEPRVFLKRGDHIVNATAITARDDGHLTCQFDLPLQVPARSFDVFVNGAKDGTISFANGFFARDWRWQKAKLPSDGGVGQFGGGRFGLSLPFQPNIMESIRNLMLHVPMWFTMFLLMGISFAQSIRPFGWVATWTATTVRCRR